MNFIDSNTISTPSKHGYEELAADNIAHLYHISCEGFNIVFTPLSFLATPSTRFLYGSVSFLHLLLHIFRIFVLAVLRLIGRKTSCANCAIAEAMYARTLGRTREAAWS